MKLIRMVALAAALLGGATLSAHAQGGMRGGGRGGGRMMERLLTGIQLSDAQKASIDSIQSAYRSQMPPRTPGSPPDDATRAKMREVMQKENADIRKVLTPDQQKMFDKNLADMRSRMGGGGPPSR